MADPGDPFGGAAITGVTPGTLMQGESGVLQITGNKTHFDSTSAISFSATGITASDVAAASATALTATVALDLAAQVGAGDVTVTTGIEAVTGAGMFAVQAAPPATISVSPDTEMRGTVDTVQINGVDTHFDSTSVVSFSGGGITISAVSVLSATALEATMTIDPSAPLETSDVTVTTGGEVATGGVFTVEVNPALVKITDVVPGSAAQGDTGVDVEITGQHTSFDETSVVSFAGAGVIISAFSVVSATVMKATVSVDPAAALGASDVTVTTGTEVATGTGVFRVITPTSKAEVLREAVNSYLRQNHPLEQDAVDICEEFIANINEALRSQVAGKGTGVLINVGVRR